jgi:hypothetical protein
VIRPVKLARIQKTNVTADNVEAPMGEGLLLLIVVDRVLLET